VTEAKEQQVRDEIEDFTYPTCGGSKLLHIPASEHSTQPLCPYVQEGNWHRSPVETWPVEHREMCARCVEEYLSTEN
jgi:hypothetical protein